MTQTPKQLGFVMPAEWEQHGALWLAWPYDGITFPSRVEKVETVYAQIIKTVCPDEPVELLVKDEAMQQRAKELLQKNDVDLSKVTFHITDYADVWIRDYGPSFITNLQTKEQAWVKWTYNAYGNKFPDLVKDSEVFFSLRKTIDKRMFEPGIVMEGGSFEVNGKGTLITTEQCLLNPNRNPKLTKQEIEKQLADNLGVTNIIWLKEGVVNDHTDGHIDDVAKFISPEIIMCAYEKDVTDANYKILDENYRILEKAVDQNGQPFKLVKLPMPHTKYDDGNIAPVSYANFYIGNKTVLVPIYNDPNDAEALKIIQDYLPRHKIAGIDCTDIIYGGGAIHCITQQQPL